MTTQVKSPQPGFVYVNDGGSLSIDGVELIERITRAVIELQGSAGSNANGQYARFNVGGVKLQVCWRGAVASSNPTTWTFPAPFSTTPVCLGTAIQSTLERMVTVNNVTLTTADFYVWAGTGASSTVPHNEFAIGTWS